MLCLCANVYEWNAKLRNSLISFFLMKHTKKSPTEQQTINISLLLFFFWGRLKMHISLSVSFYLSNSTVCIMIK